MTFTCHSLSRFLPAFDTVLPAGGSSASVAWGHAPSAESVFQETEEFFLMREEATACRMVKRFSEESGSRADPEIPTPRRGNFRGLLSRAPHTIRMQGDALHREWIRDSSTPRASRAT